LRRQHGLFAVRSEPDDIHSVLALQERSYAIANDTVIVDYYEADQPS
jgi:hypothetical protein